MMLDIMTVGEYLYSILQKTHKVTKINTGNELIQKAVQEKPHLIVIDNKLPDMCGVQTLKEISRYLVIPSVIVSDEEIVEDFIFGALIYPINHIQLSVAIRYALMRFKERQRLCAEIERLKDTLESRKLVERAKGLLMSRNGWSESEAFRYLQKTAMNRRVKMKNFALEVIGDQKVK